MGTLRFIGFSEIEMNSMEIHIYKLDRTSYPFVEIDEYITKSTDRYGRLQYDSFNITADDIEVTFELGQDWMFNEIPLSYEVEEYNSETGDYEISYVDLTGDSQNQKMLVNVPSSGTKSINKSYFKNFDLVPFKSESVEGFPFTHLYDISEGALEGLNGERFTRLRTGTTNPYTEIIDVGSFITELLRVPYLEDIETEETNIILGAEVSEYKAQQITQYVSNIDLGAIQIPLPDSNIGFSNITVDLFVPYFDKITLTTDRILGKSIKLDLKLNLLTGKGTLNIIALDTNTVIESFTQKVAESIPYKITSMSLEISSDVRLSSFVTPYIEIKTLVPNNSAKLISLYPVELNKDFNYLRDSEDIIMNTTATEREQKMIKDSISRGIFIRK